MLLGKITNITDLDRCLGHHRFLNLNRFVNLDRFVNLNRFLNLNRSVNLNRFVNLNNHQFFGDQGTIPWKKPTPAISHRCMGCLDFNQKKAFGNFHMIPFCVPSSPFPISGWPTSKKGGSTPYHQQHCLTAKNKPGP